MPKKEGGVQIAFRIPAEAARELDVIAAELILKNPGLKATRASLVRALMLQGLERERAKREKRK